MVSSKYMRAYFSKQPKGDRTILLYWLREEKGKKKKTWSWLLHKSVIQNTNERYTPKLRVFATPNLSLKKKQSKEQKNENKLKQTGL